MVEVGINVWKCVSASIGTLRYPGRGLGGRQPEVNSQGLELICINVTPLDGLHLSCGGDKVHFGGLSER